MTESSVLVATLSADREDYQSFGAIKYLFLPFPSSIMSLTTWIFYVPSVRWLPRLCGRRKAWRRYVVYFGKSCAR